ncbi:26S proteasome non-ATPase regulatory subunit 3 isoform X1 [Gopherus flavomarginatus]|uniref:26S proteasome non-ATPase regulatory subunit 3 isoform X1 n=1 Tax=Gopherus flavomarginatus TaxID=286002 RepID=UPI0021CBA778|nr:26S proteasome non-ATPase regulatory subunit 3 isoform X1 [Gopherus flavomarginatus]
MKQEGASRRRPAADKAKPPPEEPPPGPPDVEMQEEAADGAGGAAGEKPPQRELDAITLEDIKEHVKQLEKAVSGKEPRYVLRALRALPSTSRRLNPNVLHKAINGFFTSNSTVRDFLLGFLEEPMDTEAELQFRPRTGKAASAPLLPEVETYLQLLLVIYLMNSKRYPEAQKVSDDLMQKISPQNRRALDLVVAKCYYYHSRSYEFLNKLDVVRSFLHARLRTATLRHDADGQATLLNLLLRNYLHYNLYDQAEKLVSKSVFPEQANNNEWARYLYYTGRIKAIQLEYSEARRTMTNALRKAPQHTAVGFKQTVHKLLIVVELLLGEIPDRLQFRQPSLKRSLMPYFLLTQAVRTGNLAKFNQVLDQFADKFQADGTYTLIIRLRHNVIKTGVRMISLSYSRIALADIAQKLQLDSPEDAEFIVAKALLNQLSAPPKGSVTSLLLLGSGPSAAPRACIPINPFMPGCSDPKRSLIPTHLATSVISLSNCYQGMLHQEKLEVFPVSGKGMWAQGLRDQTDQVAVLWEPVQSAHSAIPGC